ncbi:MAG: hypothetical protein HGB31_02850 [Erysipelotrichaceae bacterium]|nr:hypothetical protein [Erysipelotrichaceae bacterium]
MKTKAFLKIEEILVIGLALALLSSCLEIDGSKYYDNDITLLVASRESILGAEGGYHDKTIIIEVDSFGRILYGFIGVSHLYDDYTLAVGIVQTSDEKTVSYYDGVNMISKIYAWSTKEDELSDQIINANFNESMINDLKERNDWNEPLNPSNMFTTELRRNKNRPLSTRELNEMIEILPGDLNSSDLVLLSQDKEGRLLFIGQEYSDDGEYGSAFLIMLDKDKMIMPNMGIIEISKNQIEDPWQVLLEFKLANSWAFH